MTSPSQVATPSLGPISLVRGLRSTSGGQSRRVADASDDAVVLLDANGAVSSCNSAFAESLGIACEELLRIAYTAPELGFSPEVQTAIRNALQRGEAYVASDLSETEPQLIPSNISVSPLRTQAGSTDGVCIVRSGRRGRAELERQLVKAQELALAGLVSAGTVHDLNNLLHVIHGHARLLAAQLGPGRGDASLHEIEQAVQRASSIAANVLWFGRSGTTERNPLRLDYVVASVCDMLRPVLRRDVQLTCINEIGPVTIHGNVSQLEQIVANLCINARDAMPQGGTIEVRLREAEASAWEGIVTALGPERFIELDIQDTGEGMTEATLNHLFEPFYTTKLKGQGTGLGLAVTRMMVEAHGGAILVRSVLGEGSVFRVLLRAETFSDVPQD